MLARQQLFTFNVAGFFVAFQSTLSCALAVLAGILAWFLKKYKNAKSLEKLSKTNFNGEFCRVTYVTFFL